MFRKIAFIILLFSQQFCVLADDSAPTSEQTPQYVSKEAWMATLNQKLPQDLCTSESQFLTCFDLEISECQSMVKWFSQSCLQSMNKKLPNTMSPKDGEKHGKLLGRCVYDLYNLFLKNQKIDDETCPDYEPPQGLSEAPTSLEKPILRDPTQPRTSQ